LSPFYDIFLSSYNRAANVNNNNNNHLHGLVWIAVQRSRSTFLCCCR
jgi:hypothetical protein